eukprot:CAMPEP_0115091990 /NCGR_PEP_ID=MMETSP0227-20121206/26462_1 /TAXON_ID=89957 /ORGANISM="Polarella glacialis, Strain CCMP 1383" /LENGTH=37 /DNA_ID= /DNA_START= /DNA_END= /DNA_ORIENTATION=
MRAGAIQATGAAGGLHLQLIRVLLSHVVAVQTIRDRE